VTFSHIGISLAESETIFGILNSVFHVMEEDLEDLFNDQSVPAGVKLSFPYPFSDAFFELFAEGWFQIKHVLKDMRRRRGNREFRVQFSFDSFLRDKEIVHAGLVFKLKNLSQREFEMGLEKIEYQVDMVTMESSGRSEGGDPYTYVYNPLRRKWMQQNDYLGS
jgi:hypothetical protein